MTESLAAATLARLRAHMDAAPFAALILGEPENVAYATGYRSVGADLFRSHRMAAVVRPDDVVVVAPAADAGAISELGVRLEPYGRFYFEGADRDHPAVRAADRHPVFESALSAAVGKPAGPVGVDAAFTSGGVAGMATADARSWLARLKAVKLPAEIERLRVAARLASNGIEAAVTGAASGVTERELARLIAATMAAGGGMPRFVVVTAGERSALSDARATDRPLRNGDLVRFDVGCTVDGYWSDVGRTVVVGGPDSLQSRRYAAILAGESAQLEQIRSGLDAGELFDTAVATIEANGLRPYRRHHCGHGIGSAVYESPPVSPSGRGIPLEENMVLCLETPFYEIGWGGMMVEDTVVVTGSGHERLTAGDRSLRQVGE